MINLHISLLSQLCAFCTCLSHFISIIEFILKFGFALTMRMYHLKKILVHVMFAVVLHLRHCTSHGSNMQLNQHS